MSQMHTTFVKEDDLISILERFMLRELNKKGVEDWAENNDANDSIEFSSDLVRDLVFELSSPEINGELSDERALQLIEILKSNRLSA